MTLHIKHRNIYVIMKCVKNEFDPKEDNEEK